MTADDLDHAEEELVKTVRFFPMPADFLAFTGVNKAQALYRKAPIGKCACGLELSFPESHRRGYCGKCWRGLLAANGLTEADELDSSAPGQKKIEGRASSRWDDRSPNGLAHIGDIL